MLPLAVAILLQTRLVLPDAGLATAAKASPRPEQCRSAAGQDGLWLRLRDANSQRYCELMARGYARLAETPAEALSAAEAARALAGALPAVRLLIGRAQLRLGQSRVALEQFAQAEAADANAFVDPKALHDYARAASLSGAPTDALRLYRLLVSRAGLLGDARESAFVQIEAAAHVLAYAPNASDEALGYLTQARRQTLGLSPLVDGLRRIAQQTRSARSKPSALPAAPFDDVRAPLIPASLLAELNAPLSEPMHRGKAR